jgi:hypothetical protein
LKLQTLLVTIMVLSVVFMFSSPPFLSLQIMMSWISQMGDSCRKPHQNWYTSYKYKWITLTYRDKPHKVRLQRVRPWSLIKNWALLFAPKGIIGGRVIEIRHSFSITVYKPSNICISTINLWVDFAMIR